MNNTNSTTTCLLKTTLDMPHFQPQAEDILTDEDLLELFRIIKQIIRKKPDTERIAKLFFCIVYALGDLYHFYKPIHSDCIVFRDDSNVNAPITADVQLPTSVSCCQGQQHANAPASANNTPAALSEAAAAAAAAAAGVTVTVTTSPMSVQQQQAQGQVPQRLLSVSYLTNPSPTQQQQQQKQLPHIMSRPSAPLAAIQRGDETSTDQYSVRPYTNIRPIYPSTASPTNSSPSSSTSYSMQQPPWSPISEQHHQQQQPPQTTAAAVAPSPPPAPPPPLPPNRYPHLNTLIHNHTNEEVLMEPKQRGFYYQDGRITREPALLQRYAEQGVLTQASLMRKRKKTYNEGGSEFPYELSTIPAPAAKKPKIPHRHGEFKQRRDDIISRMRTIMMADLEQKAQRLPNHFTLGIEKAELPSNINVDNLSQEEAGNLLAPALRILTLHSNMKPHLDNGMNQNGIYYNNDYFRLYLAFVQFQNIFVELFPNEVIKISTPPLNVTPPIEDNMASPGGSFSMAERDKDRERNANMKAYRVWIEPFLTETNWAAFRRNIMVGERIMQLTKVVGQGVLLMTKELSGSKLHLTFTNNEWDEFIQGLSQGTWDETIDWSHDELDQDNTIEKEAGTSLLVNELRLKFATHFWFTDQGTVVPSAERKAARAKERQQSLNKQ